MIKMKEAKKTKAKKLKFELEDCVVCSGIRNEIFVCTPSWYAKTCETYSMKIFNRGLTCQFVEK